MNTCLSLHPRPPTRQCLVSMREGEDNREKDLHFDIRHYPRLILDIILALARISISPQQMLHDGRPHQMPLFHSPATPSELLSYLVSCQSYPTTLIVCCPREPFQDALAHHVASILTSGSNSSCEDSPPSTPQRHKRAVEALVSAPLYQTAIAKHIRVLFVPTVSHLRAYLSVFDPADAKIPPPPNHDPATDRSRIPLLMIYGFLDAHRDTSEWNAQGLSCTVSILVEAAARTTYKPVIVEPKGDDGHPSLETLLSEAVPLLGPNVANQGVWSGRTVEIRRIFGRWFQLRDGPLGEGTRLDQT